MKRFPTNWSLVFIVMLAACSQAEAPPAEISDADAAAVRAEIDKYVQTALAGDHEAWGNTLTEEVVMMPPNADPIRGRAAAVAWIKSFPKITKFTVDVEEVAGMGDVAYARGIFAVDFTLPDGTAGSDRGSFLEIHRKQADGRWPYTRLIWHSNTPLPVPSTTTQ